MFVDAFPFMTNLLVHEWPRKRSGDDIAEASRFGQQPKETRANEATRSRKQREEARKSDESRRGHRPSRLEQRDKYLSVERVSDGRRQTPRTGQRTAPDRTGDAVDTPLSRASGSAYHETSSKLGGVLDCPGVYQPCNLIRQST